jgi:hypothetical protein
MSSPKGDNRVSEATRVCVGWATADDQPEEKLLTVRDDFAAAVAREGDDPEIESILLAVCHATGMGFVAVARVTVDRWIAAQVLNGSKLGLNPGDDLNIKKTICNDVRQSGEAVIIDHVSEDPTWRTHPIPKLFGFESYVSLPILLEDGSFYGTLCALDPEPRSLSGLETVALLRSCADRVGTILSVNRATAVRAPEIGRAASIIPRSPQGRREAFFKLLEGLGESAWQRNLKTGEVWFSPSLSRTNPPARRRVSIRRD